MYYFVLEIFNIFRLFFSLEKSDFEFIFKDLVSVIEIHFKLTEFLKVVI